MLRTNPGRIVAALLALWLAVSTAGPWLHACPVHDGVGAAAAAGHGGHSGHGVAASQDDRDAPAPDSAHLCRCPGSCCTVTPLELPRGVTVTAAPVVSLRDPGLPDHAYVPVSRTLLLPFANGPPRA